MRFVSTVVWYSPTNTQFVSFHDNANEPSARVLSCHAVFVFDFWGRLQVMFVFFLPTKNPVSPDFLLTLPR